MEKLKQKAEEFKGDLSKILQPVWLPKLLHEEDFLHYHAFFEEYQHNHNQHMVVAMARLGATYDRVKEACKTHHERCHVAPYTPGDDKTQTVEKDTIESDNIEDYLGQNRGYYKILDHFLKLYETKYKKDIKAMIREEVPKTVDGPLLSAFHGIIQVGYGCVGESDMAVIQGIAIMHMQYSPPVPVDKSLLRDTSAFGKSSTDIFETVQIVHQDPSLVSRTTEIANNNEEYHKKSPGNHFDWMGMAIIENYSDRFLKLSDAIYLPDFFNKGNEQVSDLQKLLIWFQNIATVLYVRSDLVNNLFILHGITGTWSLRQVIELLDYKDALIAVRTHICAVLMTYLICKAPGMTKKPEDFWKGNTVDQEEWDKVITDLLSKDYECHIFKVVQVLYEAWKENPDSSHNETYIAGARIAVDCPFDAAPFPQRDVPTVV